MQRNYLDEINNLAYDLSFMFASPLHVCFCIFLFRAGSEHAESIINDQLRVWDEGNKMYQELQNQLDCQRALTNK